MSKIVTCAGDKDAGCQKHDDNRCCVICHESEDCPDVCMEYILAQENDMDVDCELFQIGEVQSDEEVEDN